MELRNLNLNTLKLNRTIIPFSKFKIDGFTPREEFQRKAYSILEDIIGKMPSDATFSAECKKRFGKYYFNITVNGSNTRFEAHTIIDPSEEDTDDRNWLNKAIEKLHNSMNIQIDHWLQSRSFS